MKIFLSIIVAVSLLACKKDKVPALVIAPIFHAPETFEKMHDCNITSINTVSTKFFDSNFGVRSIFYNLQITKDGGATWIQKAFPLSAYGGNHFICNENEFYHFNSKIYHTLDGGDSFTEIAAVNTHDLLFITPTIGIRRAQHIFKTFDKGFTWVKTYDAESMGVNNLEMTSNTIGFATVSLNFDQTNVGKIIKTIDGGNTWFDIGPETNLAFADLSFVNDQVGYLTTVQHDPTGTLGNLMRTKDGGQTWEILQNPFGTLDIGHVQIDFVNETEGYIWSYNSGKVYLTKDSGNTTSLIFESTCNSIRDIQQAGNTIFIIGEDGLIMRSK
jgi:photosystem II stability/assembly factor-like uncharacterized protein